MTKILKNATFSDFKDLEIYYFGGNRKMKHKTEYNKFPTLKNVTFIP